MAKLTRPPRPLLGLLVPLSVRFELGCQSAARGSQTQMFLQQDRASSNVSSGDSVPTQMDMTEDSMFHKQVALTKMLVNSGQGSVPSSLVCIHKSHPKTNSRSLFKNNF